MGFANSRGKYQLGRTIGEGTFAKVKLAVNRHNGQYVAIKVIDKNMVIESGLKFQAWSIFVFFLLLFEEELTRNNGCFSCINT